MITTLKHAIIDEDPMTGTVTVRLRPLSKSRTATETVTTAFMSDDDYDCILGRNKVSEIVAMTLICATAVASIDWLTYEHRDKLPKEIVETFDQWFVSRDHHHISTKEG